MEGPKGVGECHVSIPRERARKPRETRMNGGHPSRVLEIEGPPSIPFPQPKRTGPRAVRSRKPRPFEEPFLGTMKNAGKKDLSPPSHTPGGVLSAVGGEHWERGFQKGGRRRGGGATRAKKALFGKTRRPNLLRPGLPKTPDRGPWKGGQKQSALGGKGLVDRAGPAKGPDPDPRTRESPPTGPRILGAIHRGGEPPPGLPLPTKKSPTKTPTWTPPETPPARGSGGPGVDTRKATEEVNRDVFPPRKSRRKSPPSPLRPPTGGLGQKPGTPGGNTHHRGKPPEAGGKGSGPGTEKAPGSHWWYPLPTSAGPGRAFIRATVSAPRESHRHPVPSTHGKPSRPNCQPVRGPRAPKSGPQRNRRLLRGGPEKGIRRRGKGTLSPRPPREKRAPQARNWAPTAVPRRPRQKPARQPSHKNRRRHRCPGKTGGGKREGAPRSSAAGRGEVHIEGTSEEKGGKGARGGRKLGGGSPRTVAFGARVGQLSFPRRSTPGSIPLPQTQKEALWREAGKGPRDPRVSENGTQNLKWTSIFP
ncbi:hypothetical protein GWK47_036122 [Chionoecetes opilio]|uniref:Uncharacterized protein n=1 Tax=Chionoecetes opilio TaxID=41210 RepID=A0A8J4YEI3_CHIOP|nr:hypothetical protein GWK47_036122 [Chionoecetes opilio]